MKSRCLSEHGLACCLVCPLLLCVSAGSFQPIRTPCPAMGTKGARSTMEDLPLPCHSPSAGQQPPCPPPSCDSVPGSRLMLLRWLSFTRSLLLLAGPSKSSPSTDARIQLESRAPDEVMLNGAGVFRLAPGWFML